MRYNPTKKALLTPEAQPPLYHAGDPWPPDAIYAELSRLAYIRFDEGRTDALRAALAQGGFGEPATFFGGTLGAQAYGTVSRDGTACLVFRGTQADRPHDLICDARFVPKAFPGGGRVHSGFSDAVDSLSGEIEPWLARVGGAPLVVTGHSLGAGMATIVAARVPRAQLVTFGSPRVGDAAFAALFDGRDVRRYVDCCDIVATVPPPLGYRHLEGERYIDRTGRVAAVPPGEAARLLERGHADLDYVRKCSGRPGNVAVRELADHAPINYVSAVLGVREGP